MRRPVGTRGMTLVEMLVVLAIIAILAGLLFTVVARSRESGRRAACIHNIKQQLDLVKEWEGREDQLPSEVPDQQRYPEIFECPSDPGRGEGHSSYEYYPTEDPHTPLIVCKHHLRYGVVLAAYYDGQVRTIPAARYTGP